MKNLIYFYLRSMMVMKLLKSQKVTEVKAKNLMIKLDMTKLIKYLKLRLLPMKPWRQQNKIYLQLNLKNTNSLLLYFKTRMKKI